MFQHTVGIHGAVVGDDLAADLRLGEPVVVGLLHAVIHVRNAIHEGAAFFGGVIGRGKFFLNGIILKCGNVFRHGSFLRNGFFRLCGDFLWLGSGFFPNYFFGGGDIPGVLRFLVCGKEGQLFGNDFLLVPFGKLFVVHIVFLQGQRMTICSATACAAA